MNFIYTFSNRRGYTTNENLLSLEILRLIPTTTTTTSTFRNRPLDLNLVPTNKLLINIVCLLIN